MGFTPAELGQYAARSEGQSHKHNAVPYLVGESTTCPYAVLTLLGTVVAECHYPSAYAGSGDAAMAKANAAFIVRACNMHDDLLGFLNLVAAGHLTQSGFVEAAKNVQRRIAKHQQSGGEA